MKKRISLILILIVFFLAGVLGTLGVFSGKIESVSADVTNKEFVNMILTGGQGYYPYSYFDSLDQASHTEENVSYLNRNGELTSVYRAIKGDSTSFFSSKYSQGSVKIVLTGEMRALAENCNYYVYASAGLLALENSDKSKVAISVSANGETKSATSNLVYSSGNYQPDWVTTEKIYITPETTEITFSFITAGQSSVWDKAHFYIFEPTVSFGTEIDEIVVENTDGTAYQGELIPFIASNDILDVESDGALMTYYKNYHSVQWEIVDGASNAEIVGNYLKINNGRGIVKVRAKCLKSSLSNEYFYSQIISYSIDNSQYAVNLLSNFEDGGDFWGTAIHSTSKESTVLLTTVHEGYSFLYYLDEDGNQIEHTITKSGAYRASITLGKSRTIKAYLVKDIFVNQIVIEDKYYDKTSNANITDVIVEGICEGHDVDVDWSELQAEFTSVTPGENTLINLRGRVYITGEDSYMYNFRSTLPLTTGNILKRIVTIQANDASKSYGDTDPEFSYVLQSNMLQGDALSGSLERIQGEMVGEYRITQGTLTHPCYDINFISGHFEIHKREITISNVVFNDKSYDGTANVIPSNVFYTQKGTLIAEHDINLIITGQYASAVVGENISATVNFELTGTDSVNYILNGTTFDVTGDIVPKQLVVSAVRKEKTYGETDPALEYTYDSNELIDGDFITGELQRTSGEDVGEYRIGAGTLCAENYQIEFVSNVLVINKVVLEITADDKTKIYGTPDEELTYQISSGSLVEETTLGLTLTRAIGEDVGSYSIVVRAQTNQNYQVNFVAGNYEITKRDITINIFTVEREYDGTSLGEIGFDITNILAQDAIGINAYALFEDKNIGTQTVTYYTNNDELVSEFTTDILTGHCVSNYAVTFNAEYTSSINKKEITVVLANDAVITKQYAQEDQEIAFYAEGIVEGETLTGNLVRVEGENVGSYTINQGTLTDENNPNYSITMDIQDFYTIAQRIVKIVVDNKEIVYGESEGETLYYLSAETPLNGTLILSDMISGNPSRQSGNNVGEYDFKIGTLSLANEFLANYKLVFEGEKLTITKRDIEIRLNDCTKAYGSSDPLHSYEIISGNFVSDENLIYLREAGENVGEYELNAIVDSENYNATIISSTLTITPVSITIRANNVLKIYGDEDCNLTFVFTSGILLLNDTKESIFSGSLGREAGENVGEYTINQGTLTSNDNYILSFISGTMTIIKRDITVVADQVKKFIDSAEIPELTYTVAEGLINGDTLDGELSVEFVDVLGEYDISRGTISSSNYNITFVSAKFIVAKRQLNIIIEYSSKEYDGTASANLIYRIGEGSDLKEGDNLGISLTREQGVGTGRYLITATVANENYVANVVTNYFEITRRKITIEANDITITYGDALPATCEWGYTVQGQIINNEITVSLYRTQTYCVGEFPILASIQNASNYEITYIPGTLKITKRVIHVAVEDYEKIYGISDPNFEYSVEEGGMYNGDILQGSISRLEGENVGEYELVCLLYNVNYIIIMNEATLTIVPKELTMITSAVDKTYDGTDVAYLRTPALSGIIEGDEVSLEYQPSELARFVDAGVGDDKFVIVYGGQLVGEDAGNYIIKYPEGLTASISNLVIKDEDVSVYASKANTKLRYGTEVIAEAVEEDSVKEYFADNKSVIDSYNISMTYNQEYFENYGSVTVAITLSTDRELHNVQLFVLKEDGTKELVASEYKDGVVSFETNQLGTYIVIADNDRWLDYCLLGFGIALTTLGCAVMAAKGIKKRKKAR